MGFRLVDTSLTALTFSIFSQLNICKADCAILQCLKKATIYIVKEFIHPKVSLNNREFLIWKDRGTRGRPAGQQAGIFKIRLGLGGEIDR